MFLDFHWYKSKTFSSHQFRVTVSEVTTLVSAHAFVYASSYWWLTIFQASVSRLKVDPDIINKYIFLVMYRISRPIRRTLIVSLEILEKIMMNTF
jgi:hypothetical protein